MGGKFYTANTANVFSSSDSGKTWTPTTATGSESLFLSAGNNVLIATSAGGGVIQRFDGTNWSSISTAWALRGSTYGYINGKHTFVAVGDTGRSVRSFDGGATWAGGADSTLGNVNAYHRVAFGNGLFVATDSWSGAMRYSTDGINWVVTTGPNNVARTIGFADGYFIAVDTHDTKTGTVSYSSNGINWILAGIPAGITTTPSIAVGQGNLAYNPIDNVWMIGITGPNGGIIRSPLMQK